ncbi:AEC family transporter [Hydrogenophilus thiooxidans]|uniref:AEC family transporter n=1 Tax=Hydrogenophilus thiooxidans TaxID=2820326 RepID=UPI001C23561C|nr:AEC family transporter [Hydrogenophilus thiooxidans]
MDALTLIFPDFACIALGALLKRVLLTDDRFWVGVERLVYFVLFPALLFRSLANAPFALHDALALIASGAAVMGAGFVLVFALGRWVGDEPLAVASRAQCAYRFNTYIGMAVAQQAYGATGLAWMGVLCGALVPLANVLAVGSMARRAPGGLRHLVANPLVLATLAGLLFHAAGGVVPQPVDALLARLAAAAVAIGLLAVGAALTPSRDLMRSGGLVAAIKLVVSPALAWLLGRWLGLPPLPFAILVLFAALPSASSAYILASRMGGDGPGVARLISLTTVVSAVTLTFWLGVLASN